MATAEINPAVTAGTAPVFRSLPIAPIAGSTKVRVDETWRPGRRRHAMQIIEFRPMVALSGDWGRNIASTRVVEPADTLAGVADQLAAGFRFEFSPELVDLARRVGVGRRLAGYEIDELAARLAHQAADILD